MSFLRTQKEGPSKVDAISSVIYSNYCVKSLFLTICKALSSFPRPCSRVDCAKALHSLSSHTSWALKVGTVWQ